MICAKKMQPYGLSRIAFRGGEEEIRPTAKRAKQISQSGACNKEFGNAVACGNAAQNLLDRNTKPY